MKFRKALPVLKFHALCKSEHTLLPTLNSHIKTLMRGLQPGPKLPHRSPTLGTLKSGSFPFFLALFCLHTRTFSTLPTALHHPRLLRAVSAGCLWCSFLSFHPLWAFYNSWHYWFSFSSLKLLFWKPHDIGLFSSLFILSDSEIVSLQGLSLLFLRWRLSNRYL